MKGSYNNRIFIVVVLSGMLFSFAALNGCARLNQGSEEGTGAKNKMGKEMLVAKDIGGGLPFGVIEWCGNASLLIDSDKFGKEWVDFNGNKVTVSTKETDHLIGCTPDGKWVLYADWQNAREYKDKQGRTPENIVDEGPGWHGSVSDLYRYEIATGIRQKFAVVRDDSAGLVSPDGLKVLLGNRHDWDIEMPEPRWEKVWLTNEWLYGNTFWFADSSGIVTMIWGNGYSLGVEVFGENGFAKEFSLEEIGKGRNVVLEGVDKEERFYLTTAEETRTDKVWARTRYNFFRCAIKDKELVCEKINEFDNRKYDISSSELLANGDFIFSGGEDNSCIRRIRPGQTNAECIADTQYGDNAYEVIHSFTFYPSVSPDGKRMAFERGKMPSKPGGRFYYYQLDLFVKELSED